jgi:hypothetical protein
MTQALYAYMSNKTIKKKKIDTGFKKNSKYFRKKFIMKDGGLWLLPPHPTTYPRYHWRS